MYCSVSLENEDQPRRIFFLVVGKERSKEVGIREELPRVRRLMENVQIGYRRGVEGAAPYSFQQPHSQAIDRWKCLRANSVLFRPHSAKKTDKIETGAVRLMTQPPFSFCCVLTGSKPMRSRSACMLRNSDGCHCSISGKPVLPPFAPASSAVGAICPGC